MKTKKTIQILLTLFTLLAFEYSYSQHRNDKTFQKGFRAGYDTTIRMSQISDLKTGGGEIDRCSYGFSSSDSEKDAYSAGYNCGKDQARILIANFKDNLRKKKDAEKSYKMRLKNIENENRERQYLIEQQKSRMRQQELRRYNNQKTVDGLLSAGDTILLRKNKMKYTLLPKTIMIK